MWFTCCSKVGGGGGCHFLANLTVNRHSAFALIFFFFYLCILKKKKSWMYGTSAVAAPLHRCGTTVTSVSPSDCTHLHIMSVRFNSRDFFLSLSLFNILLVLNSHLMAGGLCFCTQRKHKLTEFSSNDSIKTFSVFGEFLWVVFFSLAERRRTAQNATLGL